MTGAGSGLGLATARQLVRLGALVLALDFNEETGAGVEAELGRDKVLFVRCDVKEEEDVVQALKAMEDKWSGKQLGGVVHCGGVGMAGKVRLGGVRMSEKLTG